MRKAIVLSTLIVLCSTASAAEPFFHENFANGIPDNFFLADLDGNTPCPDLNFPSNTAWTSWTDPEDADNKIAASCSYYEPAGIANDWMVLPLMDLPADSSSCQLYWRSRSAFDTFKDGYLVMVCEDTALPPKQLVGNSNVWKLVHRVGNGQHPASWTAQHADLSAYAGKKIYMAFVNTTPDGWMLYLDDITIGERESVAKANVKLTTNRYAVGGSAQISAEVKVGIMDSISELNVRIVSGKDTLVERCSLTHQLLPNEKIDIILKNELKGTPGQVKEYVLELFDDNIVYARAMGEIVYAISLDAPKYIVAEGLINRGQNGGFGPRLIEGYQLMAKSSDHFIGIQVHGPDVTEDNLSATGHQAYREKLLQLQDRGYGQGVVVDRILCGDVYDQISSLCMSRQMSQPLCSAKISAICYDNSLVAQAVCKFAVPLQQNEMAYEWMIVEDSIASYQWNAYSGGLFGSFCGYEFKDLNVPVVFNGVMRDRFAAEDFVFGRLDNAGDSLLVQLDTPVAFDFYNLDHVKVILLIKDNQTGAILNASECNLAFQVRGDANGDHIVDVTDVMMIVNHILNKNPQPFYFVNADVDNNHVIDVSDAMKIVGIILSNDTFN